MSWREQYEARRCSAAEAAALIKDGDRIYMGGNAATPRALAGALAARAAAGEIGGVEVSHVLLLGEDPFREVRDRVRHRALFVGPADREAVNCGRADYVPCHLSDIPRLLREGGLEVAMLTVSPPDSHGFFSLGVEVLASLAAAKVAGRVIVQVNRRMPRVHGNTWLHVSEVHAIVEHDEELIELIPDAPGPVEQAIAAHIVPLIPPEATLQLGIGAIPDAVVSLLAGRDDLGVHTEMVSDGVMAGVRRGVLTGRCKSRFPRKVVTTFILGTRALYDWVHDNPQVEALPCDETNDLELAAANRRLVAINSALSVDLSGQVNADSIGTRIYSGVGGQVDFIRAAARCPGGQPIIALSSTASGGRLSRIVPCLAEGAGVVTGRADVHWIVTEHGAARLHGRTLRERARALIEIAHPDFRPMLREAAAARFGGAW